MQLPSTSEEKKRASSSTFHITKHHAATQNADLRAIFSLGNNDAILSLQSFFFCHPFDMLVCVEINYLGWTKKNWASSWDILNLLGFPFWLRFVHNYHLTFLHGYTWFMNIHEFFSLSLSIKFGLINNSSEVAYHAFHGRRL